MALFRLRIAEKYQDSGATTTSKMLELVLGGCLFSEDDWYPSFENIIKADSFTFVMPIESSLVSDVYSGYPKYKTYRR